MLSVMLFLVVIAASVSAVCEACECQTNDDCDYLDYKYCSNDSIMKIDGICVDGYCIEDLQNPSTYKDCNDNNRDYCIRSVSVHEDYTCEELLQPTCVVDTNSSRDCSDGLFCNGQETCEGAGVCQNGTAVDCSYNDITGVATCDNTPDDFSSTYDYRAPFTSVCDEEQDTCTTGNETITHTCADADANDGGPGAAAPLTCSAECDGYGTECEPHIEGDYCYYDGDCNTDPASCACEYVDKYCPEPGTVTDGVCYYGTKDCTPNGCALESEEMMCRTVCDPELGPIDPTGPYVPRDSMNVEPNPAGPQCDENLITATAIENCTNIAGAEFYVHTQDYGSVCTPQEELPWGTMDASDGAFDELTEDVEAIVDVSGLQDGGQYQYCVRAKNDDGHWGSCECKRLEIDNKHPRLEDHWVTNVHWTDSYGKWVCGDDFGYYAYFCDQDNESCIGDAEYFVKPPQDWEMVAGTGHPMYPSDGAFSEPETTCDEAYDNVTNGDYVEGTHEIKSEALDCACNWGKLIFQTPETVVIDRTPPVTEKTVEDPKFECDYMDDGDNNQIESCYYVKNTTIITLTAYDQDNSWDGIYSDDVTIHYRYRYKLNYTDQWGAWSDWVHVNANEETFSFNEDSIHELEYYATDRCGNEETHHFEIDIVDSKPPVTVKDITGPQVEGDGDPVHMYLNSRSVITLTCTDQQPHPVDDVTLYWQMYYKLNSEDEWVLIDDGDSGPVKQFTDLNESYHKLVYWCEDSLGNAEVAQVEIDAVDNTAPVFNKTITGPQVEGDGDPVHMYLTNDSVVRLECYDLGPHPVGVDYIDWAMYYKLNWEDSWELVDEGTGGDYAEFTNMNDSYHQLVYYCVDKLGNAVKEAEIDAVDNTAPVSAKDLSGPQVACDEEDPNDCHYYINQDTKIYLTCRDQMPHPVGGEELYYRYQINDGNFTDWMAYEDYIQYENDSRHTLEYYCIDLLGNEEEVQVEVDVVDSQPPIVNKTVGEPKIACEDPEDCDYWITRDTNITLECHDPDPHPVNDVRIWYRYGVDDEPEGWMVYEGPFSFDEDSYHYLEYYCEDALGNRGDTQYEVDRVDSTPPETLKRYGEPMYGEGYPKWITSETPVTLEAEDGGKICAVGVNKTYWRNTLVDDEFCYDQELCVLEAEGQGNFTEYTGPFYKPETSCHLIEYYSVDYLGNREQVKKQCVFVDNEAPELVKILGDPKIVKVMNSTCDEGDGGEPLPPSQYSVGDEVHTISFPEGGGTGVGVAFDGEFLYYTYINSKNLYKIRPDGTGHALINTTGIAEAGLGALSYDATRGKIWAGTYGCDQGNGGPVYLIDPATGVATYMFSVPSAYINYCLDDGIAYDAKDDSIWYSDDVSSTMVHMSANGTLLGTVDVCAIDSRLCHRNSGIAIGGDNFYLGSDGNDVTLRVHRDDLTLLDEFVNVNFRIEDMECDPQTYGPTEVMWVRDAYAGQARAYAIEPNTCGLGGEAPEPCDNESVQTFITQETTITFECEDSNPHPVDHVETYYRYNVDGGEWTDWILYEGPFSFREDSVHTLQYYCVDALGNSNGTEADPHVEVDRVDSTPPETVKTYGQPMVVRDGVRWITSNTPVMLEATDGGEICAVGVNKTYWRNTLVDDEFCWEGYEACAQAEGEGEFNEYLEAFYKPETSCHLIEYYSVDYLGNREKVKKQCVFVDNEAPALTKEVGEPKIECDEEDPTGCHYWVTNETPIDLYCSDIYPHPVNNVSLWYRVKLDDGNWSEWVDPIGVIEIPGVHKRIYLNDSDSVHTLQYYCVDALGNSNGTREAPIEQVYRVDNTPPNTTKVIMGCYTPCDWDAGEECHYWINSDTEIGFDAVDGGEVCAVGVDYTKYRHKYDGHGWYPWSTYDPEENLSFHMEGIHMLKYYSVDRLGNEEDMQYEVDVVDNTPPRGWVQNPVSGRYYHDGETFTVMAPAVDFGHPPSGVAECEFQAIDIHFEDLTDQEIIQVQRMMKFNHNMDELLDFLDGRYTLVDLGTVPYDGRYCRGTLTVPEDSGITDKAYMVIKVKDRSCNEYYDLAREFVDGFIFGDTILMDFDNSAPHVVITDHDGLEGTVEAGHHFIVYASVEEYDSGADECWGELYMEAPLCHTEQYNETVEVCSEHPVVDEGCMAECEGNESECEEVCTHMEEECHNETVTTNVTVCDDYDLQFIDQYTGVMLSDHECRVVGDLPDETEDGNYRFVVSARDEEFNIGSDYVRFMMDAAPPDKTLYSPVEGEIYGPAGIPVKVGMADFSGIAEETVQYRVYEPGVDLDAAYSSGGLYDSGWLGTTLTEGTMYDGNYTDTFDVVGAGLSSGSYFMRVRGCDGLYEAPLPEGSEIPLHCSDPVMSIVIDLDPPEGPTNVVKSGDELTWDAATDALSGMGHYNVYCDDTKVGETEELSYTTNGTECAYGVSAVDKVGNEGSPVEATTPDNNNDNGGSDSGNTYTGPQGGGYIGGSGGSSGGSGGSSTSDKEPEPVCQALGDVCSSDTDCCEGSCVENACTVVEEQPKGATDLIDVVAPEYADVGTLVTVRAQHRSDGSPLPNAELYVITPSNEVIKRMTDENGEVKYTTQQEGWYKYDVPNYEKGSVTSTYVAKKAAPSTGGAEAAPPGETGGADVPVTTGLLFGVLAPEIAGLLVLLLLVAAYLAYRRYSNEG